MNIDFEPILFTEIAEALRDKHNDMAVTDVAVATPPRFPAAAVFEMSNTTYTRSLDTKERHAVTSWQAEVFSDDPWAARYRCKEIMQTIDEIFLKYNFTRTFGEFVANADSRIARRVHRYTAVVSNDGVMYRR